MQYTPCGLLLRCLIYATTSQVNSVPLLRSRIYPIPPREKPFMSDTDKRKNTDGTPDPKAFDDDQALILKSLPILEKVHAQLARNLPDTGNTPSLNELIKSIFDGAIFAHDRARTQDW